MSKQSDAYEKVSKALAKDPEQSVTDLLEKLEVSASTYYQGRRKALGKRASAKVAASKKVVRRRPEDSDQVIIITNSSQLRALISEFK